MVKKERAMSTTHSLPGYSAITVETDVPAQMQDGTVLYADIYRPSSGGPFPVILMRSPYDKRQAQCGSGYRHPAWYAQHGYMVVVQDVRGRYRSGGDFYPFANEANDGFDTVEWASSLPHANGRVGMYGFSYVGCTQVQAALKRPEGLRTICPGFTASQYYEHWAYNGGAFALAFNSSWAMALAEEGAIRRRDGELIRRLIEGVSTAPSWYPYLPMNEHPLLASTDLGDFYFDWMAHPSYDDYWRRWSVDEDYSRIEVPALHIGGWYDIFIGGTVRNFTGLRHHAGSDAARAGQKLLVGPWHHTYWSRVVGTLDFGPEAANRIDDMQLRWFDQFLRDQQTGVLDSPVSVFLMGANHWEDFSTWPPEGVVYRSYFLHSEGDAHTVSGNGRLDIEPPGSEPPDVFGYNPLAPVPSFGGRSCCDPSITPMGPYPQVDVEMLGSVQVYTTRPLERDLTVIGPVTCTLFAATSATDTDFTAKLCDVSPGGLSINIANGIIRARFRESLSDPKPVTPGEVYEYTIELGPTAHVFRAGHSIRLQVSSCDFPHWDRNLNTGGTLGTEGPEAAVVATQVVLHDGAHASHLSLPVME
jgi:uncharacterized protein